MKTLITGGNSATALKLLKAFTHQHVLLADYGEIPHFSSANYELKSLGLKNEDTTAHHLLSFCLDNEIAAILPLHLFEIKAVANAKLLFNEFNIQVILPDEQFIALYLNESLKSNDWLLFLNGELMFSTLNPLPADINVQVKKLSGAFYCFTNNNKLSLITIQ